MPITDQILAKDNCKHCYIQKHALFYKQTHRTIHLVYECDKANKLVHLPYQSGLNIPLVKTKKQLEKEALNNSLRLF